MNLVFFFFFPEVYVWDDFDCLFLVYWVCICSLVFAYNCYPEVCFKGLIPNVVIVIKMYLTMVLLDVDHFVIFTCIFLAWLCYRLSPRAREQFETSGALTFPYTHLLKFSWATYLKIVWFDIWIGKLSEKIT